MFILSDVWQLVITEEAATDKKYTIHRAAQLEFRTYSVVIVVTVRKNENKQHY